MYPFTARSIILRPVAGVAYGYRVLAQIDEITEKVLGVVNEVKIFGKNISFSRLLRKTVIKPIDAPNITANIENDVLIIGYY